MQRIVIIGQPGSGKSTLARALGAATGLPVYHIDKEVHWMPGWQQRSEAEKTRLCYAIHRKPQWIFEGGHSRTWDDRLQHADTLIWLDHPLGRRTVRVLWRIIRYWGRSRPDLPEGCPERIGTKTYAFLLWIWSTQKSARTNIAEIYNTAPKRVTKHHFQHFDEADQFVAQVALNRQAARSHAPK